MDRRIVESAAKAIVDQAARRVLAPLEGECLACYVYRQLSEFGCNGTHRFAVYFRDSSAPRATALLKNLAVMGAGRCDCEIFQRAYLLGARPLLINLPRTAVDGERATWQGMGSKEQFLWCQNVRRGSTQPCGNWERATG